MSEHHDSEEIGGVPVDSEIGGLPPAPDSGEYSYSATDTLSNLQV